jgi:hypothetical protein
MKQVRALVMGFYNGTRIYPGQVFSVPNNLTGSWFEIEGVETETLRRRRRRKVEQPEAEAESEPASDE